MKSAELRLKIAGGCIVVCGLTFIVESFKKTKKE